MAEKILGIDLGTTNSVVAVMIGNEPTVISNQEGSSWHTVWIKRKMLRSWFMTSEEEPLTYQYLKAGKVL